MSAGTLWFLYSLPDVLCKTPVQAGAPSAPTNFAAGVAAAVAATLLTQPADMLRTHMQVRAGPAPGRCRASHSHVQTGACWFSCCRVLAHAHTGTRVPLCCLPALRLLWASSAAGRDYARATARRTLLAGTQVVLWTLACPSCGVCP